MFLANLLKVEVQYNHHDNALTEYLCAIECFIKYVLNRGTTSLFVLLKLYLLWGFTIMWDMLLGAKSLYILYISFTKLNLYMKNSESHFASLITSCEKPYRILAALRCKIYKELKLSLQLKPPHTGNANGTEEVSISHTVQRLYQAGQRGYVYLYF